MGSFIENESVWVERVASFRSKNTGMPLLQNEALPCPDVDSNASAYEHFISENKLNPEERLLLHLCYKTLLYPAYMHPLFSKANYLHGQAVDNPNLGALQGTTYPGVLPSAYFFIHLAGGLVLTERTRIARLLLQKEYTLFRTDAIELIQPVNAETPLTGYLRLRPDYFLLLSKPLELAP